MAAKRILTAARLREMLCYDPETGCFAWIQRRQARKKTGVAGYAHRLPDGKARIVIVIDHKAYKGHRLAWLYMTGNWPNGHIDHRNGDPSDNRWSNLRDATESQNHWNRGTPSNNTSGLIGAHFDKYWGVWKSRIGGRYLGQFKTKEAAHEAYRRAALALYGEYAHDTLRRTVGQRHKAN